LDAKKTGFYDIHKKSGAKIVEFAGYLMPVQYKGIMEEHRRVRSSVGLFDVSHMGEFFVAGENALPYLQNLTINDVGKLSVNQVQYSAMCYPDGGIVDDLLVYRLDDRYLMVVNAANIDKDWNWAKDQLVDGVALENKSDDYSLLALQGPDAEATLQKITAIPLKEIRYYWLAEGEVAGVPMTVSRTGYTGEPGFELLFARKHSLPVWSALMDAGREFDIEPIGLGARDTLRLEMKYCLYGNDIDVSTNPIEAGLGWITHTDKGDFIGCKAILRIKEEGVRRKLVGFVMTEKGIPRHGYAIYNDSDLIGHVTSGTMSPMLQKPIGMGYVRREFAEPGQAVFIEIRNQHLSAEIVRTPFYRRP
jgi:aminomethyltransferase